VGSGPIAYWAFDEGSGTTPARRAVRQVGQSVVLEWVGQGTLQQSGEANGPWTNLSSATSPQTVAIDAPSRFFRIIAQ